MHQLLMSLAPAQVPLGEPTLGPHQSKDISTSSINRDQQVTSSEVTSLPHTLSGL